MVLNLCKSGGWSFVAKSLICLKIWNHFFTSIQFLTVRNHVNPVDFVIAIAECVHKTISNHYPTPMKHRMVSSHSQLNPSSFIQSITCHCVVSVPVI